MRSLALALALVPYVVPGLDGSRARVPERGQPQGSGSPRSADGLAQEELRARLREARELRERGEFELARARIAEAIAVALELLAAPADEDLLELGGELGAAAHELGDSKDAERVFRAVLESAERDFGASHRHVHAALQALAGTLYTLGDLHGARVLYERLIEARERSLPEGHPDLARARLGLAATLKMLGDLEGALEIEQRLLEDFERRLSADHPELLMLRQNLAGTLYGLGDLDAARTLYESVLEVRERSLPADHHDLQVVRKNLAMTVKALGDVQGALLLERQVLEVFERTLPAEHPNVQRARMGLAVTLHGQGDLPGARILFERVLEVYERTLPADHPELQWVRGNLAVTIRQLGDLRGARALEERVLELRERALPPDHPDLQVARQNLAVTIGLLGDAERARQLLERVLESMQRTLPEDHPSIQAARLNLALSLKELGDFEGALAQEQLALEAFERTLPAAHPDLQAARSNLAGTIYLLGDVGEARRLEEEVLELMERTLPTDHPDLQRFRLNLCTTIARQLAAGSAGERDRERCTDIARELARSQVLAARRALLTGSAREAEECAAGSAAFLSLVLSLAQGRGASEPIEALVEPAFSLSESTRAAALASARIARGARGTPHHERMAQELRSASAELAELQRRGAGPEELQSARARREASERELLLVAREFVGEGLLQPEVDSRAVTARSSEKSALIAYRGYDRTWLEEREPEHPGAEPSLSEGVTYSLCAFVLSPADPEQDPRLSIVDLGPMESVDLAVRSWRARIGAGTTAPADPSAEPVVAHRGVGLAGVTMGEERSAAALLRQRVWDPLVAALGDAERVIVVLDDVLHLVPFDALPFDEGDALLGDRWRIETRVAAWELLVEPRGIAPGGALVALGSASFDSKPALTIEEPALEEEAPASTRGEGAIPSRLVARGSSFAPLEHTGPEVREIAQLFASLGEREALILEGRRASREALEGVDERANWLHVATHGWFAPESVRSWSDVQEGERAAGSPWRASAEEVVRGMNPMLLCGIALAGANLPADSLGHVPGLVTAEELSTFDLWSCELAVLSACDTNVGERRSGQGVASLQRALHMAGARSAITSLWKVPDQATRELMLEFYRRLWIEKQPKSQALWEAKKRLREARDDAGRPRYTTRDWAGWVLTGEPD